MKGTGTVTIAVSRGALSIIADAVFGYGFMRSRRGASSEASALLAWSRELYLKTWEDQPSGGIKVPFTRLGALWEWLKHPLRSRIALELTEAQLKDLEIALGYMAVRSARLGCQKKPRWCLRQANRFRALRLKLNRRKHLKALKAPPGRRRHFSTKFPKMKGACVCQIKDAPQRKSILQG